MKYEIKGGSFPIVEFTLNKGEKLLTDAGAMSWMDGNMTMETTSNGGIKKMLGRLVTSERLMQNYFTANADNSKITLGVCSRIYYGIRN